MTTIRVADLPADPVAAAGAFHAAWLPAIMAALDGAAGDVLIAFPAADHAHDGWRRAAVQGLARMAAASSAATRLRVNAVAGGDRAAVAAARAWLAAAPGITGQVFALDGQDDRSGVRQAHA